MEARISRNRLPSGTHGRRQPCWHLDFCPVRDIWIFWSKRINWCCFKSAALTFYTPATSFMEENFFSHRLGGGLLGGRDSSTLHLPNTLLLLLLHIVYCTTHQWWWYRVSKSRVSCFPIRGWPHLGVRGWEVPPRMLILCSLIATCHSLIGFWYRSASSWLVMVSVQSCLSVNVILFLQPLLSVSITASAPFHIRRC